MENVLFQNCRTVVTEWLYVKISLPEVVILLKQNSKLSLLDKVTRAYFETLLEGSPQQQRAWIGTSSFRIRSVKMFGKMIALA